MQTLMQTVDTCPKTVEILKFVAIELKETIPGEKSFEHDS